MTSSTQDTENELVTKKVNEESDPWEDTPTVVEHVGAPDRDFLTVTLKAGTGFDAPWLVFHTNSVDEALESLQHEQLDELMDLAGRKGKEFAKAFGGSQGFSKPAATTGGWKGKPAASSSSEVPSGTCPTHNCDLAFADEFTKRDGTKVSARVGCPVPKCYAKTFWKNDDGSWTEK